MIKIRHVMESEKQPYKLHHTGISATILFILACGAGTWRMSTGSLSGGYLPGFLHAIFFLFCMLLLAQHYKMIAYMVLPAVLTGWSCFDYLYDITAPFLSINDGAEAIRTLRVQQYILRTIYHITPVDLIWFLLAGICLFGVIFCIRRYLSPVHLHHTLLTKIIAGVYVAISLALLPLGLITAN